MRKILRLNLIVLILSCGAVAQESAGDLPLSRLRSDYNQVGLVARVKVKDVRFAAPSIHPIYVLRGEVIEPFKGRHRRGQSLEFYMAMEEGFDVNSLLGDWIVFLKGSAHTPSNKPGWFALENSSLPSSDKLIAKLRRIKNANVRGRNRRSLTTLSTGVRINVPFI